MIGVKINFVVTDCQQALEMYRHIFDIQHESVTNDEHGANEAEFTMYGTKFHILDGTPKCKTVESNPSAPGFIWIDITVPDIKDIYKKAMAAGCQELQSPTELEGLCVTNAVFADPFGFVWMLQQE